MGTLVSVESGKLKSEVNGEVQEMIDMAGTVRWVACSSDVAVRVGRFRAQARVIEIPAHREVIQAL